MTDLRPRLSRDRDGIAIDALAIGETKVVITDPSSSEGSYQIGPYDSDVVVRFYSYFTFIIGTSAEAIVNYHTGSSSSELPRFEADVLKVPGETVERFRIPQGESLFVHAPYLNGGLEVSVTILK